MLIVPTHRGFTLIELLVVIAIIGILSSVVLVAIGNARNSGADTGVKGNLNTIRKQAEVYANTTFNYDTVSNVSTAPATATCGTTGMWADPAIAQAVKGAVAQAGVGQLNSVASQSALCKWTTSTWFLAVVLRSNPAKAWCADSLGRAKEVNTSQIDTSMEVGLLIACP